jgi:hypothetical protein
MLKFTLYVETLGGSARSDEEILRTIGDVGGRVLGKAASEPAPVPVPVPNGQPGWAPSGDGFVLLAPAIVPRVRIRPCLDGTWSWQVDNQPVRFAPSRDEAARRAEALLRGVPEADEPGSVRYVPPTDEKLLEEGREAFGRLVSIWARHFGVEGAEQPDRKAALMSCFSGYGKAVGRYIRERGGLAGACIDVCAKLNLTAADKANALGKQIAMNMVQVGTADLGLEIDKLLERSMFVRVEEGQMPAWLDEPPIAGVADQTVNFDRSALPVPEIPAGMRS